MIRTRAIKTAAASELALTRHTSTSYVYIIIIVIIIGNILNSHPLWVGFGTHMWACAKSNMADVQHRVLKIRKGKTKVIDIRIILEKL